MATTTTNFGWDIPQSTDLVKDGATAIAALGQDIDTALVDLKGGTTGQVLAKASGTDLDFSWVAQDDSNAIQNAIVDAKGDLIGATAADTPARLAVGTNGQVLTADSTAATGLAWATPTASGLTLVTTGTYSGVAAANINNCFTSTYTNYFVIINNTGVTGTVNFGLRFRASGTDSTTGYYVAGGYNNFNSSTNNVTALNNGAQIMDWDLTSEPNFIYNMDISKPALAANTFFSSAWSKGSGAAGNISGVHQVATAYDGLTIFSPTGTITGSYWIYGYAKA